MKKKRLRFLRIVLIVLAALIITAIVAPEIFVNRILKLAIEKAGTKALAVNVNIEDVSLSIISGKLSLEDLIIDNPEGYQHDRFLEMRQGDIEVDTKSLFSDSIYIDNITLDEIKVVFEQKGISGNNLQDLIKQFPAKQDDKASDGKQLHIKKLEIKNTEVPVKLLPVPGKLDTIPFKLSTIEMTDLGTDNKLDIIDLTRKILLAIAAGIAKQGTGIIPDEMLNSFTSELQKFGELSGVLLDSGKIIFKSGTDIGKEVQKIGDDIGKGILKDIDNTGKGITEGLKGILNPKDE